MSTNEYDDESFPVPHGDTTTLLHRAREAWQAASHEATMAATAHRRGRLPTATLLELERRQTATYSAYAALRGPLDAEEEWY